jgi:hypothetical protein
MTSSTEVTPSIAKRTLHERHEAWQPRDEPIEGDQVGAPDRVGELAVDFEQLVDADAPSVARHVAVGAAHAFGELGGRDLLCREIPRQPRALVHAGLDRVRAVVAQAAQQALRENTVERGRDQVALGAHVEQPAHGRQRVLGVQRREHHVTRHCRPQADLGRLLVAHLADEHDVGVVPQRRAQNGGER